MMDNFFNGALSAIHSFRGYMEQLLFYSDQLPFMNTFLMQSGFLSYINVMHLFLLQKEGSQPLFEVYCVVFIRCTTVICCHLLSFVVTRCHSLSLDGRLICLFINNHNVLRKCNNFFFGTFTYLYNLFVKIFQKNVLFFTST